MKGLHPEALKDTLTRRLRRHPLPEGEGFAGVEA